MNGQARSLALAAGLFSAPAHAIEIPFDTGPLVFEVVAGAASFATAPLPDSTCPFLVSTFCATFDDSVQQTDPYRLTGVADTETLVVRDLSVEGAPATFHAALEFPAGAAEAVVDPLGFDPPFSVSFADVSVLYEASITFTPATQPDPLPIDPVDLDVSVAFVEVALSETTTVLFDGMAEPIPIFGSSSCPDGVASIRFEQTPAPAVGEIALSPSPNPEPVLPTTDSLVNVFLCGGESPIRTQFGISSFDIEAAIGQVLASETGGVVTVDLLEPFAAFPFYQQATFVPEPGTGLRLLAGLAGLAVLGGRRRPGRGVRPGGALWRWLTSRDSSRRTTSRTTRARNDNAPTEAGTCRSESKLRGA